MAINVNSCLKPSSSPPTPPPLPPPNSTTIATWSKRDEASWRRRCVSTMACAIIGSSTVGFVGDAGVLAMELPVMEATEAKVVARWSDRRRCPPWHENSLENVVPENLPRPSGGRKSHGQVSFHAAPAVKAPVRYNSSCYSL